MKKLFHRSKRSWLWLCFLGCLLLNASAWSQSITNVVALTNLPPYVAAGGQWRDIVGVRGGIDQYSTNATIFRNVVAYYGADTNGVVDAWGAIEDAIYNCPFGQVVYLPAGKYYLSHGLSRVGSWNFGSPTQNPFSVILRGDGQDKTILLDGSTGNEEIISFTMATGPSIGHWTIESGNARGSQSISCSSATTPWVSYAGQWVMIARGNKDGWIGTTNAGVFIPHGDNTGSNTFFTVYQDSASQMVQVTNISGTTFGISPALNEAYSLDGLNFFSSQPVHCGIEDLKVVRLNDVGSIKNIRIIGGEECWIKNVESQQAEGYHISLEYCGGCEVRECYVHDPFLVNSGGGGSDYGIVLGFYSSSCLVEDNIALHCRHSFIMETSAGQGNVIAYNYGKDNINEGMFGTSYQMDTAFHGGEPRFTLLEGNVWPIIRVDGIEGTTKHAIYFRNLVTMDGIASVNVAMFAMDIQQGNMMNFFLDNIFLKTNAVNGFGGMVYRLGSFEDTAGADAGVITNNIWLDNYDFSTGLYDHSTNGVIAWNASASGTNWPASLLYSNKPAWFGANAWPPFGVDVAGKTNLIPAQVRAAALPEFNRVTTGYTLTLLATNGSLAVPSGFFGTYYNGAIVAVTATPSSTNWIFAGYAPTNGFLIAPTNAGNYFEMPAKDLTFAGLFNTNTSSGGNVVLTAGQMIWLCPEASRIGVFK